MDEGLKILARPQCPVYDFKIYHKPRGPPARPESRPPGGKRWGGKWHQPLAGLTRDQKILTFRGNVPWRDSGRWGPCPPPP
ncbi:hypothetical protein DFAR_3800034 [Desulfarculales bacterium]